LRRKFLALPPSEGQQGLHEVIQLEDNVVLYKTVGGKRFSLQVKGRMFGYGVDTTVPSGKWSTLRVEFAGQLFTVFFNGSKLFEVEDNTFTEPGNDRCVDKGR
jgi:hypothetical protein